jgi:hypothetical protein
VILEVNPSASFYSEDLIARRLHWLLGLSCLWFTHRVQVLVWTQAPVPPHQAVNMLVFSIENDGEESLSFWESGEYLRLESCLQGKPDCGLRRPAISVYVCYAV